MPFCLSVYVTLTKYLANFFTDMVLLESVSIYIGGGVPQITRSQGLKKIICTNKRFASIQFVIAVCIFGYLSVYTLQLTKYIC